MRSLPTLLLSLCLLVSLQCGAAAEINIFVKKPDARWQIFAENPDGKSQLIETQIKAPNLPDSSAPRSEVIVSRSEKAHSGDALQLSWKESWRAALNFSSDNPIDLRAYKNGVISFDLKIDQLAKGGLSFKLSCGNNCYRQVPYTLPARALVGQGWQKMSLPLNCLIHDGDDLSAVNTPFALEAGGEGQVTLANVKIKSQGKANISCQDYKTRAVTPEMLNEWWAIEWWLPRHEKKLQEIKSHPIDLVFIGDSITEGWEKSGAPVWAKYYAKRNAIALGFGGDRTENILWRLQQGEVDGLNPKVVVLMCGTNNTGQRHEEPELTARGIERDVQELRERLPNTKILLLAIFPRDEKPDGESRKINDSINKLIAPFADNKAIFFLDINKAFLDTDGVLSKTIMPDLLHPNEKGYEIWAKTMEPQLRQLLNEH